jgi:hypothetical protein
MDNTLSIAVDRTKYTWKDLKGKLVVQAELDPKAPGAEVG